MSLLFFPLEETLGLSTALNRYLPSLQASAAACCKAICEEVIGREDEWKMGSTKIFLKVRKTSNPNQAVV